MLSGAPSVEGAHLADEPQDVTARRLALLARMLVEPLVGRVAPPEKQVGSTTTPHVPLEMVYGTC
jgi:hypothetical protein